MRYSESRFTCTHNIIKYTKCTRFCQSNNAHLRCKCYLRFAICARYLTNFGLFLIFFSWFCGKVIAVSRALENALEDYRISPNKVEVVYNGVDIFLTAPVKMDVYSACLIMMKKFFCPCCTVCILEKSYRFLRNIIACYILLT